jgi:hypothetical protein
MWLSAWLMRKGCEGGPLQSVLRSSARTHDLEISFSKYEVIGWKCVSVRGAKGSVRQFQKVWTAHIEREVYNLEKYTQNKQGDIVWDEIHPPSGCGDFRFK